MSHQIVKFNQTNNKIEKHDFNAVDSKGRKIGAQVETFDRLVEVDPEGQARGYGVVHQMGLGTFYCFRGDATRDGSRYGSGTPTNTFRTIAERDVAVAKYLKGAQKRAERVL